MLMNTLRVVIVYYTKKKKDMTFNENVTKDCTASCHDVHVSLQSF